MATLATAAAAPPCRSLGVQCRSLRVTLRIGELEEGPESLDHEATWLLGHTQHIDFLELWEGEGDLYVEAVLHVPCRYLHQEGPDRTLPGSRLRRSGAARGAATAAAVATRGGPIRPRRGCRNAVQTLPLPPRSLPVLESHAGADNPCATAPCRTADNTRKAACCRDLQVEIMCTRAPAPSGGPGALAPITLPVQDRARRRFFPRGRNDLRLRLPRGRRRLLQSPWPPSAGRAHGQARFVLRMAPQEPGPPSWLCLWPTPAASPPGLSRKCARRGRLAVLSGDPASPMFAETAAVGHLWRVGD